MGRMPSGEVQLLAPARPATDNRIAVANRVPGESEGEQLGRVADDELRLQVVRIERVGADGLADVLAADEELTAIVEEGLEGIATLGGEAVGAVETRVPDNYRIVAKRIAARRARGLGAVLVVEHAQTVAGLPIPAVNGSCGIVVDE